jgi:Skp family chaperone for outer membrane proteins
MIMRRASLATAALVLGLVTAVAAPTAHAQPAAAGPQPTKLGVVNMQKVFEQLQEAKDLRATLEAKKQEFNSLGQARQSELNSLKQQLANGPKPDSQQYDDLAQQIEQKAVTYDNELKLKQLTMTRDLGHQLKALFDKIEVSVGDVAKQKGLDLVLTEIRPEFPSNMREMTPEQIQNLIGSRNILYKSDKIDITSEVVTALDAKYKSGK